MYHIGFIIFQNVRSYRSNNTVCLRAPTLFHKVSYSDKDYTIYIYDLIISIVSHASKEIHENLPKMFIEHLLIYSVYFSLGNTKGSMEIIVSELR